MINLQTTPRPELFEAALTLNHGNLYLLIPLNRLLSSNNSAQVCIFKEFFVFEQTWPLHFNLLVILWVP